MTWRPIQDRIHVRVTITAKTKGGIHLIGESRVKEQMAEVLAVGPGLRDNENRLIPMKVKVGDTVLYPQFTGNKLSNYDPDVDDDIWTLRESEVIAVMP